MARRGKDRTTELFAGMDGAQGTQSLQRTVYERIAAAILDGHLRPGDRLPSTRELAKSLGIGRNTVTWAVEQLAVEGFVETRHGSGTFVSMQLPDAPRPNGDDAAGRAAAVARIARRAERYAAVARSLRVPQRPVPFRINMPAVDDFPVSLWRRLMKSLMSDSAIGAAALLGETEPAGYGPLREAIARYLMINRGVVCAADQVVIVAGAQQGLDLAMRLLLDPGDKVWCEDPGFPGSVAALRAAGAAIGAVPVDAEGFDLAAAQRLHPDARLAVVCPSSQFPLGSTLSLPRRLALIDWARQSNGWIVEDDYDSEFRYRGRPVRSLQGLDGGERVVYVGTFSKMLFPGLRLAYVVVPRPFVELFVNARIVAGRQSPTFEQVIVERFISEGHLGRHIARMRRLYAARRAALIEAARRRLPGLLELRPADTGLQLLAWLPEGWSDQAVSQAAAGHGLEITPLSRLAVERAMPPALLLGFGNFTPAAIEDGLERLAAALEEARPER
ncbi:PLP-dependent aminotransferase family protein [Aquibium sp. A9E412]|uniref:MocR-like pyridoxine biosynthesis transcription factor PdxR n=1 Tax=Aquibium sp. A9E412 TaxID=2976767 RepID=UPI0025AEDA7D|nr:PLP-dependent aminotransferase family protein [Aquibium sp. A9E412]MDN2564867.1 PLP-dependent aminotransferase family protein [Aquibium sp. A9E412]